MLRPAQLFRLIHINWVLFRHGLDEIIFATHLFRPLRWIFVLSPWRWWRTPERRAPRGERIRRALEDLGPIFIKFGQILSTRRDLLPDDIAIELTRLQDRVPPFPVEAARATIERSLGRPITDIFVHFDDQPLASASIAQVHAARLIDGREVVVKVLRPRIESAIRRDVGLLYIVADLAERYWSEGRRLRPREVVSEYEKTILDELDLIREAANATQLRRNFIDSEMLYVPEVVIDLCRRDVLVMERISGIPVADLDSLRAAGINIRKLSERGVEIFFTQVFMHNFFHADMHPGNIFVDRHRREDPQYIAVDFGIVGTLSPQDQRYLAGNFLAFFRRDYRKVAELHVDSGWVPEGTRIDEFESAIRTVCEPIFERPLKEISFGQLLLRLFQTARRFDMQVQPQLVLLQKTLLNIEGLGRQLYPDLDLWRTAKPFLEKWMQEQMGPRARLRQVTQRLPEWGEVLPEIPGMAHDLLLQARSGRLRFRLQSDDLRSIEREIRRANRRSVGAILGSSFLISAALIYGLDGFRPPLLAGAPIWTWVLGAVGLLLIGRALTVDDRDG